MSGFPTILKELRTERGLTQEKLAAALGVAKSTISMYEVGERTPDFETEEAIADFFNVDLNYLRGYDGKKLAAATGDELDKEVSALFRSLSQEKRANAADYLRYLAKSEGRKEN